MMKWFIPKIGDNLKDHIESLLVANSGEVTKNYEQTKEGHLNGDDL